MLNTMITLGFITSVSVGRATIQLSLDALRFEGHHATLYLVASWREIRGNWWGSSSSLGVPLYRWMVFVGENPNRRNG